jgi:hypothetical protein
LYAAIDDCQLVLVLSFPLHVLSSAFFTTRVYGSINGFGFFGLEFSLEEPIPALTHGRDDVLIRD